MLSSVYARHNDLMSAGIALRANALLGGYPLLLAPNVRASITQLVLSGECLVLN
jgi:hypothetical protein